MSNSIKEQLYNYCLSTIEDKLSIINAVLNSAQDSANHETKSTAGDKHDTARAMAHLESEKNAKQLAEINKLKKVLPYLKDHKQTETVSLGSVVITETANYYVSLSLGKTEFEGDVFFLISAVTPIGKLLIGKKVGDTLSFNGREIQVSEIL